MDTRKDIIMRRIQSFLYPVLIAGMLAGIMPACVSAQSTVETQSHTISFLVNEQGSFWLVANVMGANRTIGGSVAHIGGFPQATDSYGLLKGASGGGRYTAAFTVLLPRPGQPIAIQYTLKATGGSVTLPS
jgi:hypothetical protein